MDLVKELLESFEKSSISKMKIEYDGLKLEMEKPVANMSECVPMAMPVAQPSLTVTQEPTETPKETGTQVHSPLVGVFYASPSPDKDAFVSVGSHVEKGQTLCIIEAMKVMNEIKAPVEGTIKSIQVKPEALVEYDQVLMVIEESHV